MSALEELGRRLKRARAARGVELSILAVATGTEEPRLREFEAGSLALSAVEILRVARELRVPPESLLHTDVPEALPRPPADALLKSTGSGYLSDSDRSLLERALDLAESFHKLGRLLGVEQLCLKFGPKPPRKRNAWESGYDDAEAARRLLGLPTGHLDSILSILEDKFDVLVLRVPFDTHGVLGAAARIGDARVVLVSQHVHRATTLRWLLAHELAHHLRDLSADGGAFADDSGELPLLTKSPLEQRADAFAYMFLAARDAVREAIGVPTGNASDARALSLTATASSVFGVSFDPMAEHLANLKYFKRSMATQLRGRAPTEKSSVATLPEENGLVRRARRCLEDHLITEREGNTLIEAAVSLM